MGALDAARRDYDRGLELARGQNDPETESFCHSDLALIEAEAGEVDAAVGHAALAIAIAKQTDSALCVVLASTAGAVAEAEAGRFADARTQARAELATIRRQGFALYYEPLLLATIARSELALGRPREALAAAEEGVAIMNARGLTTCALPAPIALAQVLLAGEGAAAAERIDAVLARAMRVARDSGARIYELQIHRELVGLARLCGDEVAAERNEAEATRLVAAMRLEPLGGGTRSIPVSRDLDQAGARRLTMRPIVIRSSVRCGGGELHRDAEASGAPGARVRVPSCALCDALDDRQAEAGAGVVAAYALGAALKRLGKRGDQLWGELLAGVLDGEHHAVGVRAGRDPHAALLGQVVDDRVVHEVRRHLQQERG